MGNRGLKSKFRDVVCPNGDCEMFNKAGHGNIIGNGTNGQKAEKLENIVVDLVVESSVIGPISHFSI